MKKSMIAAGAASVALAAMPIVGAFAVNFTDVIKTTVTDTCTFSRGTIDSGTVDPTAGHGTGESWTEGRSQDPATTIDEMTTATSITVGGSAGTKIASSNFNVVCNDTDGYTVTMSEPNLVLPTGTTQVHDWAYTRTGATPSSFTNSVWWVTSSDTDADFTGTSSIVSQDNKAVDGKNFTVTYYGWAQNNQDAGTYSASVDYTFAQIQ